MTSKTSHTSVFEIAVHFDSIRNIDLLREGLYFISCRAYTVNDNSVQRFGSMAMQSLGTMRDKASKESNKDDNRKDRKEKKDKKANNGGIFSAQFQQKATTDPHSKTKKNDGNLLTPAQVNSFTCPSIVDRCCLPYNIIGQDEQRRHIVENNLRPAKPPRAVIQSIHSLPSNSTTIIANRFTTANSLGSLYPSCGSLICSIAGHCTCFLSKTDENKADPELIYGSHSSLLSSSSSSSSSPQTLSSSQTSSSSSQTTSSSSQTPTSSSSSSSSQTSPSPTLSLLSLDPSQKLNPARHSPMETISESAQMASIDGDLGRVSGPKVTMPSSTNSKSSRLQALSGDENLSPQQRHQLLLRQQQQQQQKQLQQQSNGGNKTLVSVPSPTPLVISGTLNGTIINTIPTNFCHNNNNNNNEIKNTFLTTTTTTTATATTANTVEVYPCSRDCYPKCRCVLEDYIESSLFDFVDDEEGENDKSSRVMPFPIPSTQAKAHGAKKERYGVAHIDPVDYTFLSQIVRLQYFDQSIVLNDCCLFKIELPPPYIYSTQFDPRFPRPENAPLLYPNNPKKQQQLIDEAHHFLSDSRNLQPTALYFDISLNFFEFSTKTPNKTLTKPLLKDFHLVSTRTLCIPDIFLKSTGSIYPVKFDSNYLASTNVMIHTSLIEHKFRTIDPDDDSIKTYTRIDESESEDEDGILVLSRDKSHSPHFSSTPLQLHNQNHSSQYLGDEDGETDFSSSPLVKSTSSSMMMVHHQNACNDDYSSAALRTHIPPHTSHPHTTSTSTPTASPITLLMRNNVSIRSLPLGHENDPNELNPPKCKTNRLIMGSTMLQNDDERQIIGAKLIQESSSPGDDDQSYNDEDMRLSIEQQSQVRCSDGAYQLMNTITTTTTTTTTTSSIISSTPIGTENGDSPPITRPLIILPVDIVHSVYGTNGESLDVITPLATPIHSSHFSANHPNTNNDHLDKNNDKSTKNLSQPLTPSSTSSRLTLVPSRQPITTDPSPLLLHQSAEDGYGNNGDHIENMNDFFSSTTTPKHTQPPSPTASIRSNRSISVKSTTAPQAIDLSKFNPTRFGTEGLDPHHNNLHVDKFPSSATFSSSKLHDNNNNTNNNISLLNDRTRSTFSSFSGSRPSQLTSQPAELHLKPRVNVAHHGNLTITTITSLSTAVHGGERTEKVTFDHKTNKYEVICHCGRSFESQFSQLTPLASFIFPKARPYHRYTHIPLEDSRCVKCDAILPLHLLPYRASPYSVEQITAIMDLTHRQLLFPLFQHYFSLSGHLHNIARLLPVELREELKIELRRREMQVPSVLIAAKYSSHHRSSIAVNTTNGTRGRNFSKPSVSSSLSTFDEVPQASTARTTATTTTTTTTSTTNTSTVTTTVTKPPHTIAPIAIPNGLTTPPPGPQIFVPGHLTLKAIDTTSQSSGNSTSQSGSNNLSPTVSNGRTSDSNNTNSNNSVGLPGAPPPDIVMPRVDSIGHQALPRLDSFGSIGLTPGMAPTVDSVGSIGKIPIIPRIGSLGTDSAISALNNVNNHNPTIGIPPNASPLGSYRRSPSPNRLPSFDRCPTTLNNNNNNNPHEVKTESPLVYGRGGSHISSTESSNPLERRLTAESRELKQSSGSIFLLNKDRELSFQRTNTTGILPSSSSSLLSPSPSSFHNREQSIDVPFTGDSSGPNNDYGLERMDTNNRDRDHDRALERHPSADGNANNFVNVIALDKYPSLTIQESLQHTISFDTMESVGAPTIEHLPKSPLLQHNQGLKRGTTLGTDGYQSNQPNCSHKNISSTSSPEVSPLVGPQIVMRTLSRSNQQFNLFSDLPSSNQPQSHSLAIPPSDKPTPIESDYSQSGPQPTFIMASPKVNGKNLIDSAPTPTIISTPSTHRRTLGHTPTPTPTPTQPSSPRTANIGGGCNVDDSHHLNPAIMFNQQQQQQHQLIAELQFETTSIGGNSSSSHKRDSYHPGLVFSSNDLVPIGHSVPPLASLSSRIRSHDIHPARIAQLIQLDVQHLSQECFSLWIMYYGLLPYISRRLRRFLLNSWKLEQSEGLQSYIFKQRFPIESLPFLGLETSTMSNMRIIQEANETPPLPDIYPSLRMESPGQTFCFYQTRYQSTPIPTHHFDNNSNITNIGSTHPHRSLYQQYQQPTLVFEEGYHVDIDQYGIDTSLFTSPSSTSSPSSPSSPSSSSELDGATLPSPNYSSTISSQLSSHPSLRNQQTPQQLLDQTIQQLQPYTNTSNATGKERFWPRYAPATSIEKNIHLIVLCHGYQGTHWDMRNVRNTIATYNPDAYFLSSSANEGLTETGFHEMGERLAKEIHKYITTNISSKTVHRISFVSHSMGGIITRACLTTKSFAPWLSKCYSYVSLATPHCGFKFGQGSNLVSTGLWLLQKFKRSSSLEQLSLQDEQRKDFYKAFLYKLSQQAAVEFFNTMATTSTGSLPGSPSTSLIASILEANKIDSKNAIGEDYGNEEVRGKTTHIMANTFTVAEKKLALPTDNFDYFIRDLFSIQKYSTYATSTLSHSILQQIRNQKESSKTTPSSSISLSLDPPSAQVHTLPNGHNTANVPPPPSSQSSQHDHNKDMHKKADWNQHNWFNSTTSNIGLGMFRYVFIFASRQDSYAPFMSARVQQQSTLSYDIPTLFNYQMNATNHLFPTETTPLPSPSTTPATTTTTTTQSTENIKFIPLPPQYKIQYPTPASEMVHNMLHHLGTKINPNIVKLLRPLYIASQLLKSEQQQQHQQKHTQPFMLNPRHLQQPLPAPKHILSPMATSPLSSPQILAQQALLTPCPHHVTNSPLGSSALCPCFLSNHCTCPMYTCCLPQVFRRFEVHFPHFLLYGDELYYSAAAKAQGEQDDDVQFQGGGGNNKLFRNFDALLGRAAHISFIDNQQYFEMFMSLHWKAFL